METEPAKISIRNLKQFCIIKGTHWKPSHDEFGTSFECDICGHNVFYSDVIPVPCRHEHSDYERDIFNKHKEA